MHKHFYKILNEKVYAMAVTFVKIYTYVTVSIRVNASRTYAAVTEYTNNSSNFQTLD